MIKIIDDYFILETDNTSYVFKKDKSGVLFHLYYGKKINVDKETLKSLEFSPDHPIGNEIRLSKENPIPLEYYPQEVSSWGKGDIRQPQFLLKDKDGFTTNLFTYESHEIKESYEYITLPSVKDDLKEGEVLIVTLMDKENHIQLEDIYTVFSKYDVITRKHVIKNLNEDPVTLKNAYSMCLDLRNEDYMVKSFHGHWNYEMNEYNTKLNIGRLINESMTGTSSSRSNPLVYLYKDGSTEDTGKSYAFNLLYSGNHQESFEVDFLGNLRVLCGMNPFTFEWNLEKGKEFEVPEAIMSFSDKGFSQLSINLQNFVRNHIIEETFRLVPRKVLNNSWEACYFNFNERKLLSMARCAKRLGCELFVLDDGWFGERNDDHRGM